MTTATTLGRFGHHPDPAIDFCVEVEALEGMAIDARCGCGLADVSEVALRIAAAMTFRVGGDECAVRAKALLRRLERQVGSPTEYADYCI